MPHPHNSPLLAAVLLFFQVVPYFFVLIALEALVRWLQSKPLPRLNDSINSLSAGTIMSMCRLVTAAFEVTSYAWVYQHWRISELPWDSPLTWWLAFIGVDFGYYWFHRMAHGKSLRPIRLSHGKCRSFRPIRLAHSI